MTRPYKVAALLLVLAIGGGAFATAAAAEPRYSRLNVQASYYHFWDYGSDPESVYNRTFSYQALYQLQAIVKQERRSLSIPGRNARVAGIVQVVDAITVRQSGQAPDFEITHELRECRDQKVPPDEASNEDSDDNPFWLWETQTAGSRIQAPVFRRSRGAGLSVTGGLFIDPGGGRNFWDPGCHGRTVTEPPGHHGLQHGPRIKLPAPKPSRFKRKKRFSIACSDSLEHGPALASDGSPARNGHSFRGSQTFRARFTPFPPNKLKKMRKRLKQVQGTGMNPFVDPPDEAKDCPRP